MLATRQLRARLGENLLGHGRDRRFGRRAARLPDFLIGLTEYEGIFDGRMALQRLFDLFGVHLLATGVDAVGSAAEQHERAIGLDGRHVAREGVSDAIDLTERASRLLRILVVPEWHEAAVGHHADLTRARLHLMAVVGEHLRGARQGEHAVCVAGVSLVMIDWPMPPSVEPSTSAIANVRQVLSRPCFTSSENIAPEPKSMRRQVRSHRVGSASSARSSGFANASPTMMSCCTPSRSTASHSSTGSRPRPSSSTAVPPACGASSCRASSRCRA